MSFTSCRCRWAGVLPLLATILLVGNATAQPSGGPYGPVPQRYAIPKATHVYFVAPDGKAGATRASVSEPTTLEAALPRVVTGDAIVMRGGIYRTGGLQLNQGITIQPYLDETPVLKGKVHGWLVQKSEVLAFVQARGDEGGAGAVVVLLKPT